MNYVTRPRRLTLVVLVAYLAANSLGLLVHEHLHAHTSAEACCHDHACHAAPADSDSPALSTVADHDHACVVCRVTGQPVVAAVAAAVELSALVAPDSLPCSAAAPYSLAARLAQTRAPPAAAI
jgi:hypothetical protein